ncbi:MAG: tetratricopeptide repeat protein [Elusimicrobia bacterium]|nr:tetratricopeptide repeat protein [Elusimicrobiota bacterium]
MTRAAALALLLAAAVPSWGASGAESVKSLQAQYDAQRYQAVIDALEPSGLQKLRGENLRKGYVLLGSSYERLGRNEKTLSVYQLGTKLFPRDQDLLARLAQLLHRSGLDEQARPLFERLLKVNPVNPYGHWGLGQIDRSLGFSARAVGHYESTLKDFSGRGDVWQEYAEALYEARDFEAAETAARRALDLLAESEAPRLTLAFALRASGRVDEALAALEPLVRARHAGAMRARTLWLLEAGRYAESLAAGRVLLELVPDDPVALYARARARLAAGRAEAAAEDLERVARGTSPFSARVCGRLAGLWAGRPR